MAVKVRFVVRVNDVCLTVVGGDLVTGVLVLGYDLSGGTDLFFVDAVAVEVAFGQVGLLMGVCEGEWGCEEGGGHEEGFGMHGLVI